MKSYSRMLIVLLSLMITCSGSLFSKDTTKYKVVAVGGSVKIVKSANTFTTVVVGMPLSDREYIKVDDGYICIWCSSSKYIEIRKPGTYSLSDFRDETVNVGLRDKLFSFIFDQITEAKKEKVIDVELSSTGGVERSVDFHNSGSRLKALYPCNTIVIDSEIEFKWTEDIYDAYKFILTDEEGEVVFSKELKNTRLLLNVDDLDLMPEKHYYWSVETPMSNVMSNSVFITDDDVKDEILKEFEVLEEQLDIESPVDNIIMADFFAKKNVVNRAVKYYVNAIELSADSPEYILLYEKYLNR